MRIAKTQISLGIRSLIRVFAVRLKKPLVLRYPESAQRKLLSDWADAQADLRLRWAHMSFCWFCHEAAQMFLFRLLLINKVRKRRRLKCFCLVYYYSINAESVTFEI